MSPPDRKWFGAFEMTRVLREFSERTAWERQWLVENTWCDVCRLPDLGVAEPIEFEEDGRVFMEGYCCVCGGLVTAEIVDQRRPSR